MKKPFQKLARPEAEFTFAPFTPYLPMQDAALLRQQQSLPTSLSLLARKCSMHREATVDELRYLRTLRTLERGARLVCSQRVSYRDYCQRSGQHPPGHPFDAVHLLHLLLAFAMYGRLLALLPLPPDSWPALLLGHDYACFHEHRFMLCIALSLHTMTAAFCAMFYRMQRCNGFPILLHLHQLSPALEARFNWQPTSAGSASGEPQRMHRTVVRGRPFLRSQLPLELEFYSLCLHRHRFRAFAGRLRLAIGLSATLIGAVLLGVCLPNVLSTVYLVGRWPHAVNLLLQVAWLLVNLYFNVIVYSNDVYICFAMYCGMLLSHARLDQMYACAAVQAELAGLAGRRALWSFCRQFASCSRLVRDVNRTFSPIMGVAYYIDSGLINVLVFLVFSQRSASSLIRITYVVFAVFLFTLFSTVSLSAAHLNWKVNSGLINFLDSRHSEAINGDSSLILIQKKIDRL